MTVVFLAVRRCLPSLIENGYIVTLHDTTVGSELVYGCEYGYTAVYNWTNNRAWCTARDNVHNAFWSPPPLCEREICSDSKTIRNSHHFQTLTATNHR